MARPAAASPYQRNALAPGILAALVLFVGTTFLNAPGIFLFVEYAVAILALIVGWFGVQARQWWWAPVFVVIAVLWNPVLPFAFTGPGWVLAQPAAAVVFLVAGSMIRVERAPEPKAR